MRYVENPTDSRCREPVTRTTASKLFTSSHAFSTCPSASDCVSRDTANNEKIFNKTRPHSNVSQCIVVTDQTFLRWQTHLTEISVPLSKTRETLKICGKTSKLHIIHPHDTMRDGCCEWDDNFECTWCLLCSNGKILFRSNW
jgi:hypothetical protein